MTPSELRATLARLEMTQTGAARLIGVNDRTMRSWLDTGEHHRDVPQPVIRLLEVMERFPAVRRWLERMP